MRKLFTLCLALLAISSMPAMAQDSDEEEELDNTFQFVKRTINGTDTTWTVINDGETYNATDVEVDEFTGGAMVMSGLYVRNTSEDDSPARVHLTINSLPSGAIQFCMLGNCAQYRNVDVDNAKAGVIISGKNDDMQLEWLPDENSYGTATVTLQANPAVATSISIFNTTYTDNGRGPKITVNFVNPDPAGISNVNAKAASSEVAAIYNVRGEQLSSMQKGINIVRYADGTTRKILK